MLLPLSPVALKPTVCLVLVSGRQEGCSNSLRKQSACRESAGAFGGGGRHLQGGFPASGYGFISGEGGGHGPSVTPLIRGWSPYPSKVSPPEACSPSSLSLLSSPYTGTSNPLQASISSSVKWNRTYLTELWEL